MIAANITEKEVKLIHEKSLYLLENVGVDFEEPKILEVFKSKGIRVEGQRVFFTPDVVEKAIETFQPSFTIKTPYASVEIGGGKTVLSGLSGARNVLKDGVTRPSNVQDYLEGRILEAYTDVIDIADPLFIQLDGIPKEKDPLIKTAITLKTTHKPVVAYCDTEERAIETLDFIRDFYGVSEDQYYCLGVGNMISPFRYAKDDIEAILAFTKRNQPICITCCSMPGMTSPITLAGTIVQNNAEVLAGLVMTQIVNPGSPVIYGNLTFVSNMRQAVPVSWGPEVALFIQCAKAMADFYHVPCRTAGALSSAKDVDWQDGAETAMAMMTAYDCKIDFVLHAAGGLDGLNTYSPEKYILDEQLLAGRLSMVNREDIFSEENINMESIEEVGPDDNYLLEDDTLELYQTEIFYAKHFNIDAYATWEKNGKESVFQKAHKEVERRLATFKYPEYDERQMAMLDKILEGVL